MRRGVTVFAVAAGVVLAAGQGAVAAAGADPAVPPVLQIDGQPIDPFCFQQVEDRFVPRDCLDEGMAVKETQPDYAADGRWVERIYRFTDMPADEPGGESSAGYRYVGETPQGTVIETRFWGGGTGQFSSVMVLRRDGEAVEVVDTPFGGDRCNGGVQEVAVRDGVLTASAAITPYDLLAIALDDEPPVEAYDDIAACAICCVGTVAFTGDTLDGVTLGMEGGPAQPFSEPGDTTPQGCLDALVKERGAWEKPVTLDRAALSDLGQAFLARCLPKQ